jgi:hypothetical protein
MDLPEGFRLTTAILLRGALLFALLDLGLLLLLSRLIQPGAFMKLRRVLPVTTAVFWFGIWLWAMITFWDTVYAYLFPAWLRWYLPFGQALLTAGVAWLAYRVAGRFPHRPVLAYCLLGGVWGILSHVWAVVLGIVRKPPLLQGAHPLAAIVIAFFEFTFYFCIIVLASWILVRLKRDF